MARADGKLQAAAKDGYIGECLPAPLLLVMTESQPLFVADDKRQAGAVAKIKADGAAGYPQRGPEYPDTRAVSPIDEDTGKQAAMSEVRWRRRRPPQPRLSGASRLGVKGRAGIGKARGDFECAGMILEQRLRDKPDGRQAG